jgi:vacuolar-type H+-ATPase subunit F/Vma7
MEGKVAVIGSSDFVMPFSALGVDTFAVGETPQKIAESAKQVAEQGYALVVVAENIASAVDEVFAGYQHADTVHSRSAIHDGIRRVRHKGTRRSAQNGNRNKHNAGKVN